MTSRIIGSNAFLHNKHLALLILRKKPLRWGTRETYTSTFLLIFLGLFGFSIVVAHYTTHVLECTLFPEAAVVLTVGIVASWLAMMTDPDGSVGQELVQFSPTVFFVGLLPPIIFNSGYQVCSVIPQAWPRFFSKAPLSRFSFTPPL